MPAWTLQLAPWREPWRLRAQGTAGLACLMSCGLCCEACGVEELVCVLSCIRVGLCIAQFWRAQLVGGDLAALPPRLVGERKGEGIVTGRATGRT